MVGRVRVICLDLIAGFGEKSSGFHGILGFVASLWEDRGVRDKRVREGQRELLPRPSFWGTIL